MIAVRIFVRALVSGCQIPAAAKGFSRLQVEVEHGRVGVLAAGVGEMYAHVGLKGFLVVGESGVAIDPEQGTPRGARVGDEMRAELVEMRPEAADEHQRRVTNHILIPRFVLGEPITVVVALELAQEIEQLREKKALSGIVSPHK